MKLSWVILTFNRAETVRKAVEHNLKAAGRPIDEIVWVDNGSTDGVRDVMKEFKPDVSILNRENLGVAKGYNRGVVLATGTHIVITGCDRKMPENWAATFEKYFDGIHKTGLISCYSKPLELVSDRIRKEMENIDGFDVVRALPMEAKCFPREILRDVGHLREDFGLYGWEDVEWGNRFERVCIERGLIAYTIPGFTAEHLGTEGGVNYDGKDDADYHAFKRRESNDPRKTELMGRCRDEQYPYYSPYV